jgi:chromosome segregation ATPase
VEEVDREIQHLEKQVDTGTMRLVDEKKALSEISSLRKQRKSFAGFEDLQKGIDDVKRQIADLKKGLDDPHSKALSEKYTQIANELDGIKKEQDEAYKGISTLRDERTKLQEEQQSKWTALKAVKDQYYQAKKAFNDWEHEAYRARREKQKTEREAWEKEKRRKVADEKLEQAGQSAYMDEILTAEGLLRYFDPTFTGSSATSTGPSKFAAQATRKVEEDAPKAKGTKLMKKDEENYFMGTGGKKGKKGKKGPTASPAATPIESGKFNLSVGVIEELGKVNVEPPMGQSDVPSVIEKLKEKLAFWKKDQERKTKEVSIVKASR